MIGIIVLVLLIAHIAAHVALVVALRKKETPGRTALAFFVSPLAPYFGFKNGLQRPAWIWICTLGLYAAITSVMRGCV